jgi:hypothetical protein
MGPARPVDDDLDRQSVAARRLPCRPVLAAHDEGRELPTFLERRAESVNVAGDFPHARREKHRACRARIRTAPPQSAGLFRASRDEPCDDTWADRSEQSVLIARNGRGFADPPEHDPRDHVGSVRSGTRSCSAPGRATEARSRTPTPLAGRYWRDGSTRSASPRSRHYPLRRRGPLPCLGRRPPLRPGRHLLSLHAGRAMSHGFGAVPRAAWPRRSTAAGTHVRRAGEGEEARTALLGKSGPPLLPERGDRLLEGKGQGADGSGAKLHSAPRMLLSRYSGATRWRGATHPR